MKQRAYAYIRKDIAGVHAQRYEYELRSLAGDSGYDLARIIVEGPDGRGIEQLFELISRPDADPDTAVLLPALGHIPDTPLDDFGEYAHVETLIPRRRWTKHLTESMLTHRSVRQERDIDPQTRAVPAVQALRDGIAEAPRQFRNQVGR